MFLALALERKSVEIDIRYYLPVREGLSLFIAQLDACEDASTAMSVNRRLIQSFS